MPPVTVTSPVSNPVTSSEKVNVAVNATVELILAGTPLISTVGAAASQVAVAVTAEAGPVLSPSVAASAATLTTTLDPLVGVTASVYTLALVLAKVPFEPPVTATSAVSNPVTSSENVNVTLSASVELIADGTPVISTVGAAASQVAVAKTADAGPVLAPSVAASAATLTTTLDPLVGVTASVYVRPLPENVPFVPPVTVTSPVSNPVTSSEKVNVAVNAAVELIFDGTPVIDTVGAAASQVAVAVTAEAGPVLAPSVAAPAATLTTTLDPLVGVTASVYTLALVLANAPFVPPVTATSSVSNPVTSSENVNVAVNTVVELIANGTPVISTVGAAASHVAVAATAETGPVLAPSVAAPAATLTTTFDPLVGVTASVYTLALVLANVPFVPPVTATSPVSNPVTSSENVNVAVNTVVELIADGTPVISTVGAAASQVAVAATAEVGPVLSPSVAEFAATLTTTFDPLVGVTASVYTLALVLANVPFVPPVTATSAVSNPVTSSENVNVTLSASVELIADGTPVISTVGAVASQVAVAVTADAGPVLAPSVAASTATVTTTLDPLVGVTASVYTLALVPANAPFVPPVTATSPVSNPVTSSEKVNVTLSASVELIADGTPVISTVGADASHVAVAVTTETGPVLAPSVAAPAATVTTTLDPLVGVTASVYVRPLPENVPFVPPVTVTSVVSNPVTSSENVKVAVISLVELILDGTPVISTVGTVASRVTVTV